MNEEKDNMTFESAYDAYYKCIYKFLFSMVGQPDEAEDMSQDTFIKLYNYLAQHPPLGNTKVWLYRVASNTCINHLKRQKRFQYLLSSGRLNSPMPRQNPIEDDLIKEQERNIIRKALDKLPAREQTLLMLYRDKFSYSDMADILKIKETSVGKILSRAREKLAREIRKCKKLPLRGCPRRGRKEM